MSIIGKHLRQLFNLESPLDYKHRIDVQIASLEAQSEDLTGKEHHKERTEKGKQISSLHNDQRYVDACRVLKGLAPTHGFFKGDGPSQEDAQIDAVQAAQLAQQAEDALAEVTETEEKHIDIDSHLVKDSAQEEDMLLQSWSDRIDMLEKITPAGSASISVETVDELENVAREIVDYKARLKSEFGYTNKDLKNETELANVEARLDKIASTLLPACSEMSYGPRGSIMVEKVQPSGKSLRAWADYLRKRELDLAAKIARNHEFAFNLGPSEAKEVSKLLLEMAEIKTKLKTQGQTAHEVDRNDGVIERELRLTEIRRKQDREKSAPKHRSKDLLEALHELEEVQGEVETLKQVLREENRLTKEDMKQDPDIRELEERIAILKKLGGA